MKKEKLTLENIKKDLRWVSLSTFSAQEYWRLKYIIFLPMIAVIVGILLNNLLVGILICSIVPYHLYYYVLEQKEYKTVQKALGEALDRCNVSIDKVKLDRVVKETVNESQRPYDPGLKNENTVFYFESGSSWTVPHILEHYEWSKEFHLSCKGLENISVEGNEFFYVSLQGYPDVVYVYPCKFFELSEELKKRSDS